MSKNFFKESSREKDPFQVISQRSLKRLDWPDF